MVEHQVFNMFVCGVCVCVCMVFYIIAMVCGVCVCVHRVWIRLELKHVIALTKHRSE